MELKSIREFQEKFTEARVDLLAKLTEYVETKVMGPREAVETFAKISLMDDRNAQHYMRLMSSSDVRYMWDFKI